MSESRPLYIINATVDTLALGGISVLAFLGLTLSLGSASSTAAIALSLALQWVINWPHFSATNYRLYRSRENLAQYPMTAFALPLVVGAGTLAALLSPQVVAPHFVKLFMLWSPYHFSAQSLGISLLYARRAGWTVSRVERLALAGFIFGTFFVSTFTAETSMENESYYGIHYPGLGLPRWPAIAAEVLMYLGGFLFMVLTLARSRSPRSGVFPFIMLVPPAAQFVWFVLGHRTPSFYAFVPLFHSLQYLLIAWAMQLRERADRMGAELPPSFVRRETARWFVGNVAGGIGLFFLLPYLISGTGVSLAFATGVVIAGVQIHHFVVDGVIWKLRNPSVANPLMVSLSDFIRGTSRRQRVAA